MSTSTIPGRRRCLLGVAVLACLALAGAGCGSGGGTGPNGTDRMSIGLLPILGDAPAFMGINKGFFTDQKLHMSKHVMQGGSDIVSGVASGSLDVGFSNNISLIIAASKGLPITIISPALQANGDPSSNEDALVASTRSPITSARQLSGKTIAVNNVDNLGTLSVNYALQQAKVDYKGVKYVEIDFPEMPAALTSGRVNAAWVAEPFLTQLKEKKAVRVLSTTPATIAPYFPESSYFTSTKYYQSHRDQVNRFVKGMTKSMSYAQHNPKAIRSTIPTYTKVSPELANKVTLGEWRTTSQTPLLKKTGQLCQEYGYISKQPDWTKLLAGTSGS